MKRVLSLIMVLVLVFGMLPFAAIAGSKVSITTQPKSIVAPKGTTAKVTLKATGDGLTYTWYYKNKGASSFSKTTSFKSNTYSLSMDASRDGRQVYCVVKDKYGNKVKSNVVTLTMGNPAKITAQPKSIVAPKGTTAKVTLKATGDGLTYTWYYKNKGASSFSKTTSFKSNTYSVKMDASRDGRQVYCVVKDKYGNKVKSNVVTLTMGNPAKITAQPKSVVASKGTTAKVTLKATGDGLTYTWYYKNKGASSFSKTTSFKSNTYSIKMDASRDGRQVYCVVKDQYGNKVKSNVATLSTSASHVMVTMQPENQRVNDGSTVVFHVAAYGSGTLSYQWQYRTAGSTTWKDSPADGSKTPSVTVPATIARNGNQYRCKITCGSAVAYSDAVTLTVLLTELRLWVPQEDFGGGEGWLDDMLAQFEEAHPEYKNKITWDIKSMSEGDAGNVVKTDPEAAADVYMFAHDQIGLLQEANALVKLSGSYKEQVLADNSQTLINTVTCPDGEIYGFPMTNNTWFMYYNKEIFSEEDVKSLDTMLTKGKVAFPLTTAWYGCSFFLSNGGTLFGPLGIDASAGIQFGGQNGYDAAKKMVELVANRNFVIDESGRGVSGLKDGTVGACFSGSWEAADLKEALGDKLGAVQLPMVEIGGKNVQMRAFGGSKCVGVNPHSANREIALQLAAFLASKEAQLARYEKRGVIPAHKDLINNKTIAKDMVAVAEMNTMSNCSVVQPFIREMANFWAPMGTFGDAINWEEITMDNYKEQVDLFVHQMNGTGL